MMGPMRLPLPWGDGTHRLYVYADANCGVDESFEDNNAYSTYLTVNPFIEGALLYPRHNQNIGTDYNPTYKWNKVTGATIIVYISAARAESSSINGLRLPVCATSYFQRVP